ncbi:MAG: helix-turn-helix transcriptional regulator [Bacteroidota bacterium]|nr:helix-turn-helix transcriptional regulator [Bacteroidota bacterium]MDP4218531.1 helix-turn-helix transcriptional regulator [Bacteroidota bacterium]MDP4254114.1 helix-turn-helix transcriptional regulator [Bacteroidota bacterium]MDP4257136.1 helix-turn-helix transcriptional regulator [Bacteroidota bacterium]
MVTHAQHLENYEQWLQEFAAKLHLSVKDNQLVLPPHIGEGSLSAHTISPGLSYLIMNFRSDEDIELIREAGNEPGFSISFGDEIRLSDARDSQVLKIPAGTEVKKVFVFSSGKVAAQFLPGELLLQLEFLAREQDLASNRTFINLAHREALKEIFAIRADDPLHQVKSLALVLRLTEKFLHSFLRQETQVAPRPLKKNDLESMRHIEQILSSRLEGFPSLESLAQEVFMSTSKLKNIFKQVYGFTLYDYYNKSRLQRAKEMLVTGQCSIKQAGSEIGFSNLSHFAKAFKKEYGMLPRDMVRTR